jgi:hypothetical protein
LDLLSSGRWALLGILLSFILGGLSYQLVEIPFSRIFKKGGPFISTRRFSQFSISLLIVIISICAYVFLNKGIPSRVSEMVNLADNERFNSILDETGILNAEDEIMNSEIILLGDSFASAISEEFKKAMPVADSVGFLIQRGCPTVYGAEQSNQLHSRKCSIFTNTAINLLSNSDIAKNKKIVIINSFEYWKGNKILFVEGGSEAVTVSTDTIFLEKFIETSCRLQKNNDVYISLPIPKYTKNIPSTVALGHMFSSRTEDLRVSLEKHKIDNELAIKAGLLARKNCGITLLDPTDYLCRRGDCFFSYKGRSLYYDDAHLSRFGSQFLIPMFKQILDN